MSIGFDVVKNHSHYGCPRLPRQSTRFPNDCGLLYPLYSLREAEVLRSRILAVLESAERDRSLAEKGALNFVVVGGGPTGVEMAGTLGDMMRSLASEYKDLDLSKAQIVLVDRGDRLLPMFTEKSQVASPIMPAANDCGTGGSAVWRLRHHRQ